jgi:putative CocE/NonD family hydrolase
MTPYGSDNFHDVAMYFASQGFPFAVVDSRGRGNSAGSFRPFAQEAQDGFDVVEWLASQPYCDGRVAMWGGSYGGTAQWATAKELPPHLAAIAPASAAYPGADFPMRNNIFCPFAIQWLVLTGGRTSQAKAASDGSLWSGLFRSWYESGRSLRELDRFIGHPSVTFQEWLDHPEADAYWATYNPSVSQYAQLSIPVLTITGIYDDDQPGALRYFTEHTRFMAQDARKTHHLVIGPWDHGGTRDPKPAVEGISLGPSGVIDLRKLHAEWYRWALCGGSKPEFLKQCVAYYVTGADEWRYAAGLESITARYKTLYLDSTSASGMVVGGSGVLSTARARDASDTYCYDPRDVGTYFPNVEGIVSRREFLTHTQQLAERGSALMYQTEPFSEDTEVSGFFKVTLWLSLDCQDTDIYVSVYELSASGELVPLSTDTVRARYREDMRAARAITTSEPLRYEFNRFTFVSRLVRGGARLGLAVAPVGYLTDSPCPARNFNSGGVVSEESVADARRATVCIHSSLAHPSAVLVPLAQGE